MPFTADPMQIRVYRWHKLVAGMLGYAQSTVRHRTLAGSLGAPSASGNRVYAFPQATTVDETTTDQLVWALWQQRLPRTNPEDDIEPGRTKYLDFTVQFPLILDDFSQLVIADEDWLVDGLGNRYKIQNVKIDPSLSFWMGQLELMR